MEIAGKRVVDATKPVTINITPRDIAAGDNKNPSSCAAAKAAKHSIEDCISARVHIGRVYIEQEKKWVRYNTPDSLKQEIIAFDRGGRSLPASTPYGQSQLMKPPKAVKGMLKGLGAVARPAEQETGARN